MEEAIFENRMNGREMRIAKNASHEENASRGLRVNANNNTVGVNVRVEGMLQSEANT